MLRAVLATVGFSSTHSMPVVPNHLQTWPDIAWGGGGNCLQLRLPAERKGCEAQEGMLEGTKEVLQGRSNLGCRRGVGNRVARCSSGDLS